jgi:aminoglycoside/choline kinase family phosphotransferase
LGTFARLYLRDGKPGYLADLPLVVDYVRETLGHYAGQVEALHDFAAWFDAALLPAIAQRTWDASP